MLGTGAACAAAAAAGAAATAGAAAAAAGAAGAAAAGAAAAAGLSWAELAPIEPSVSKAAVNRKVKVLFIIVPLERFLTGFAGADADNLFQIEDENLAVADFAGAG